MSDSAGSEDRAKAWTGGPEWALELFDKFKALCSAEGFNFEDWGGTADKGREQLSVILGDQDVNATVNVRWEHHSMFRHGSFGDQHHGQSEFQADASLFAVVCYMFPWAAMACLQCGAHPNQRCASMRYYNSQDLKDSDTRTEVVMKDFLPVHVAQIGASGHCVPMDKAVVERLTSAAASELCGVFEFMRKSHLYMGKGYREEHKQVSCSEMANIMQKVSDKAEHKK